MKARIYLSFILLLAGVWVYAAVGELSFDDAVVSGVHALARGNDGKISVVAKSNRVCAMCEQFTSDALDYLAENKTQSEIIETLHLSCLGFGSLRKPCQTLVDYYVPLFFMKISSIQPDELCYKLKMCREIVSLFLQIEEDSCSICHRAMSEFVLKLKDPDMQLEILELLLKACNSMNSYAAKVKRRQTFPSCIENSSIFAMQCKKIVFEYGPIMLANAEKFLEKTDICALLHACQAGLVADA